MSVPMIFAGIAALYLVGLLLYILYYAIGLYHLNPFIRLKPLTPEEQWFVGENFPIYRNMSPLLVEKCDQRIVWFRSRKKFVYYGKLADREELNLLLSASCVLMTLGLRDYRMLRSVLRVIVYPSTYYSRINRRHHVGEYNPRLKTVIFSAEDLWEGFRVPNDNKNLAMHEFAHALSFEMGKKSTWEAKRFRVGLKKIQALFLVEDFVGQLQNTQYFREYGLTNLLEFFSVAVEHFVESPALFAKDFPELYAIIRQMLNFDFQGLGHDVKNAP